MSGSGVSRSFREKLKPSVWVGTTDDLGRLIRACRELETSRRNTLAARHVATEAERKSEKFEYWSHLSLSERKARWKEEDEKQLAKAIAGATLHMEIVSRSYEERLYGDPDAILIELERPKDVKSFEITLGSQGYWSKTSEGTGFRIVTDGDGASVTIFGYDKDWVDLTTSRLKKVLLEQRPWYFWMTRVWFVVLLTSLFAGGLISLFQLIFGPNGWLITALPLPVIGGLVGWFGDRLIPKFELFRPDSRARGSREISIVGAAILWIIGTVVLPLILR
jgi:hypothetical protein